MFRKSWPLKVGRESWHNWVEYWLIAKKKHSTKTISAYLLIATCCFFVFFFVNPYDAQWCIGMTLGAGFESRPVGIRDTDFSLNLSLLKGKVSTFLDGAFGYRDPMYPLFKKKKNAWIWGTIIETGYLLPEKDKIGNICKLLFQD